ncbi:restriction endonuclease subunit S [Rhizobium aethiopicum]|uniref:Type I restriction enzyme S subunit n=1 Tax=Rhizobium aethiopicum TaxID=1138170 RepID=A0A7W6MKP7_9HYPH|nr:type I restriction enzyme S subunit [Rhizobium aethiopicum]
MNLQALGEAVDIVAGQHIEANLYNSEFNGSAYLTGPADFGEIRPLVTKWTIAPKVFAKTTDVLVTVKGAGVGKSNLGCDAAIGRQLMALRPKQGRILQSYLFNFIRHTEQRIAGLADGATVPGIGKADLANLQIPLPPLDEQKRIAAILDKADQLRQKRRQAIALLDSLRQSIFLEMFGDPVSNPMGLPAKPLGSIVSKVGSGATPKGGDASYKPFGIPLIRSMNVRDGAFKTDGLAFIDDNQAKKLNNVIVEDGDVLLNITGASIARVCRAPKLKVAARVNQHVAIIRPKAALDSYYLEALLLAPSFKRKLLLIGEGGATRQAITKSQIEDLIVPAPAIETQMEFRNKIENIECQMRFSKIQSSSLDMAFSSLQHRAFSGQL